MTALATALGCVLLALAAQPGETREERVAGLVLSVPADAEVTTQPGLPEGGEVVAVTRGDEVLLVTVYTGEGRPGADKALGAHAEELERRLLRDGPIDTGAFKVRMLGRTRRGRTVAWTREDVAMEGRLVAAEVGGRTLVAAWTAPRSLRNASSEGVVASLALE